MKFSCLYILKVIIFTFFNPSNGSSRYFPSEMCSSGYEDCSFQLSSSERNVCHIHKQTKCLNNSVNLSLPKLQLFSERGANFLVSIQPYTAEEYGLQLSAINISLTILQKDIKGFSVIVENDSLNTTLCRLIDFQSFSKDITTPMTLFYDCFYNLVEWNIQNVKISFLSLPMNNELSYYVHIPPVMTFDSNCVWQIAIMVFHTSLSEGIVEVKFLPTPEYVNISLYSVKLIEETSNKVIRNLNVTSFSKKDIHVTFSSVKDGFYYVSVFPKMDSISNCMPAETAIFHVKTYSDKMLILYVCIIALLTLSCFSVLKCFKVCKYPELLPKQALLVHSYDCPEHESFISSFSAYLTNECKLNVSTIYGKVESSNECTLDRKARIYTKDPRQWLRDKYKEADVIIFVISEGLYITLGNDESVRVREGTPWRQQIASIREYISLQLFNSSDGRKKLCKIIFPYSSEEQVPQCLNDMGPCFKLPRDFNKFLSFAFDSNSLLRLIPKLSGSHPLSSVNGQEMFKKMKLVQTAVANKTNVRIIKKNKGVEEARNDFSVSNFSFTSVNNIESEDSETYDGDPLNINYNIFVKEWQNIFRCVHKNYKKSFENNHVELLIQEEFKHV